MNAGRSALPETSPLVLVRGPELFALVPRHPRAAARRRAIAASAVISSYAFVLSCAFVSARVGREWLLWWIPFLFVWGASHGRWLVSEERIEGFHVVRKETRILAGPDGTDARHLVLDGRDVGDPGQAEIRLLAFVDVLGGASRAATLHRHYYLVLEQNGVVHELARQDGDADGLKAAAVALATEIAGAGAEVKTVQIPGMVWQDENFLSMWASAGAVCATFSCFYWLAGDVRATLLCAAAVVARASVIPLRIAQAAAWQRNEFSRAIGVPSAKPAMASSGISTSAGWGVYWGAQVLLLAALVASLRGG